MLLRLHVGLLSSAPSACSSTSLWMPLMGNRLVGQTAAHHWGSSLTMAVMLSLQVLQCTTLSTSEVPGPRTHLYNCIILNHTLNSCVILPLQCLLPSERASHVGSVDSQTGYSSVDLLGCSCSSVPTGRLMCPGLCASACK